MEPIRFLLLIGILFSATAQQQSSSVLPTAKEWEQSTKTDAARGITYTQFTLDGKSLDPPRGPVSKPPTLEVNCTRHAKGYGEFVSGYLRVGTPLKITYVEPSEIHGTSYFPEIWVRYRLDEGKVQQDKWPPNSDKTAANFDKGALKKILRSREVTFTVEEPLGSKIAMRFDLPDSSEVAETCDVAHGKK